MAELLEIAQLGNPTLRQPSEPVENVTDKTIQQLIDDLMTTVAQANGVGIAAPQIQRSQRLFIIASRPNPRYPYAPSMEPTAMINPQMLSHSTEIVKDWEGCLSIPGLRGRVPRYQTIEVEYCDRQGTHQQQELTGFVARVFQHELDHLDGILFIDRLESTDDLFTDQEYQRRISQQ